MSLTVGCNTRIINKLNDMSEFLILFSALVHDTDHTARTNHFEINHSNLTNRYQFQSVLENHYKAKTFKYSFAMSFIKISLHTSYGKE